jgi:membrane-associated phospholipid phosphatase
MQWSVLPARVSAGACICLFASFATDVAARQAPPPITAADRTHSSAGERVSEHVATPVLRREKPVIGEAKLLGGSVAHVVTSPVRWNRKEWLALPVAGLGLFALSSFDNESRDFMRRHQSDGLDGFTTDIEKLGTIYNYQILLGFFAAGLIFDDRKARAVAVEGVASSLVAAGLITPTLQFIVGRSRPRHSDDTYRMRAFSKNISFPSGHTTHAFAVASVIATEYDPMWVKGTAYGLAGMVALSRMYHDAHHLSDVTAAALIGTVVGRSVARFGMRNRGGLSVEPAVTAESAGLAVTLRF